jgi:hypothetical protein
MFIPFQTAAGDHEKKYGEGKNEAPFFAMGSGFMGVCVWHRSHLFNEMVIIP